MHNTRTGNLGPQSDQQSRLKRFYSAILAQAFDDLAAFLNGDPIVDSRAGESTTTLAEHFDVDPATIRKVRIRSRKAA